MKIQIVYEINVPDTIEVTVSPGPPEVQEEPVQPPLRR